MARLIVYTVEPSEPVGDSVPFWAYAQYLGTDLPNGPFEAGFAFVVDPTVDADAFRQSLEDAARADAQQQGITLDPDGVVLV